MVIHGVKSTLCIIKLLIEMGADFFRSKEQKRQGKDRDQGQLPGDAEHEEKDCGRVEAGVEHGHNTVASHVSHEIHVISCLAHQAACGIASEERCALGEKLAGRNLPAQKRCDISSFENIIIPDIV